MSPNGVEIDRQRRPFIVVDPRTGRGPGVGDFKGGRQDRCRDRGGASLLDAVFEQMGEGMAINAPFSTAGPGHRSGH
ncbi:DUF3141 domain-containing protein [Bradyrhizobium sp. CB2312]|uniref:DUF3141 domain-containing protein n=1 Tax=Bradyrhizobium sp. CB2312 TaxID=3039155 RepID=UPI0024B11DB7|nr:DUF3141 domain-containing protein [Bradyrhizobium sp. CB2312]WFU76980.1 DUF3141 domain-containing protein [Bradyrhizobium sp. CB2312]